MQDKGEFVESGQYDILTEALSTPKQPCYVRTKGEYVTKREVSKKPPGGFKSSQESQVLLERKTLEK